VGGGIVNERAIFGKEDKVVTEGQERGKTPKHSEVGKKGLHKRAEEKALGEKSVRKKK